MGQRDASQVHAESSPQGMVCTPFVFEAGEDGPGVEDGDDDDGIGEVDLEVEVAACTGELHVDALGVSGRNVAGRINTFRVTGALLGEAGPWEGEHFESLSSLVR